VCSTVNLDLLPGMHVRVGGPDVGVDRPVIDLRPIMQVPQKNP
jgi:hypothetical protein